MGLGKWVARLMLAGTVAAAPVFGATASATSKASTSGAGASNSRFGFDLFARIRKTPGNACVSPLSVSMALALAREGAVGRTATQMSATLHLESGHSSGLADLRRQLALRDTSYELAIANALWVGKNTSLDSRYRSRAASAYGARIEALDFAKPRAASDTINSWVAVQTRGHISNLVPPAALSSATRLVITNAVYFAGRWEHAFERAETRDEEFYSPAESSSVPFMHTTRSYRYADDAHAQVLELPYVGGSLGMLLILPRTASDRETVERGLNLETVKKWLAGMAERPVEVHLPRFKIEASYSLEHELPALGMTDAFDPARADFSGIDGRRDLFIGQVVHRTFVAVDEAGTVAAAATGVIMPTAIVRPVPVVFRADHPFLFVIHDRHTGAVLFLGRLEQPEKGS